VHRIRDRKRTQAQEDRIAGRGSPAWPQLEQLVARQREDQRATWPASPGGGQALDEVQHRGLQAVCVLEDDDHRVVAGHPVDQRDKPGLHVADERRFITPLGHAEQEGQPLDQPIRL
jgi:hypothetical protein